MKAAQEAEAKERRAASDYERSLSEYCLRTVPLGSDRFHRRYSFSFGVTLLLHVSLPSLSLSPHTSLLSCRYWAYSHAAADEDRLFVESDTSLSTLRAVPAEAAIAETGAAGASPGAVVRDASKPYLIQCPI